jgi:hypothetical protein
MPRDATPSRCHQHAWADQVYILSESASGARRPYEAPASAMTSIATYHVRIVNGRAAASGEKKFDLSEGIARFGDILKQGGCSSVSGSSQRGRVCARPDPAGLADGGRTVASESGGSGVWWSVAREQRPVVSGQLPVKLKRQRRR